jgi:hypothetical protein
MSTLRVISTAAAGQVTRDVGFEGAKCEAQRALLDASLLVLEFRDLLQEPDASLNMSRR